jgi:hypothetical protein
MKREDRQGLLNKKRAARNIKQQEAARIASIDLKQKYSDLLPLGNEHLKDQLKRWKHELGAAASFHLHQSNRVQYVLQVCRIFFRVASLFPRTII